MDSLKRHFLKLIQAYSPTVDSHYVVVDLLVILVASVVLQAIFEGDNAENYHQRNHGNLLLEGLDNGNPVQQHQEQEVQVGSPAQEKTQQFMYQLNLLPLASHRTFLNTRALLLFFPPAIFSGYY